MDLPWYYGRQYGYGSKGPWVPNHQCSSSSELHANALYPEFLLALRSSISPTLSDVQVVRLSGCSAGRLNWFFPGQPSTELRAIFVESRRGGNANDQGWRAHFTLCVTNSAEPSHNESSTQHPGKSNLQRDRSENLQGAVILVTDLTDNSAYRISSGE